MWVQTSDAQARPSSVLELVEHRWTRFTRDAIQESEAARLVSRDVRHLKVDWPNPSNDYTWGLFPEGWVGALRVSDALALRVTPKAGLRHLSTWLAWTEHAAAGEGLEAPEVDEDAHLADVVVAGLLRLLDERIRRGIHRDYVRIREAGLTAKGRPLLKESLLRLAAGDVALLFEQTKLSADIEDNRLVYWALHRLAHMNLFSDGIRQRLYWQLGSLSASVALHPYEVSDYVDRRYSALASDYAVMHRLCSLLLEGLGPEASAGGRSFGEFTVSMWDLFQRAVGEALRRGTSEDCVVDTAHSMRLGKNFVFKPDVIVRPRTGGSPTVVEVKYKDPTAGIAPDDVRQAIAYATAAGARRAVLVFPAPGAPTESLVAGPVRLDFAHLDLSQKPQAALNAFMAQYALPIRTAAA